MNQLWNGLSRHEVICKGNLVCNWATSLLPCIATFTQLLNGRLAFEIILEEQNNLKLTCWLNKCPQFDFLGTLEDGSPVKVQNIIHNAWHSSFKEGNRLTGFIRHPNFIEKNYLDDAQSINKVFIEVTNLHLYREFCVEIATPYGNIEISQVADHKQIKYVTQGINVAGVLATLTIQFDKEYSLVESENFIHRICALLTLSQRSFVWPVTISWYNTDGNLIKTKYIEPVFDLHKVSYPLIPEESLPEFVQAALEVPSTIYAEWRLGDAQDYYIQAMSLHSAWSQAVGFFTALETIKDAYVNQSGKEQFDRYVSRKQFGKKKIANQVLELLSKNFDEYKDLLDDSKHVNLSQEEQDKRKLEIQTLKSKVGELNRPAYKIVLRNMFKSLQVGVKDEDLNQLVSLRNQIIHRGSPNYEEKLWKNATQAHQWACRFAGLVERLFLSLLKYSGPARTYETVVTPVLHDE